MTIRRFRAGSSPEPGKAQRAHAVRRHPPRAGDLHLSLVPETRLSGSPELRVLGYRVHPLTGAEVVEQIAKAVAQRRRLVMANLNVHAMATMFESPVMARLLSQPDTQVMIDGMPVLFLANLCGHRLPRAKRTTSLDFYDQMFRLGTARGWRFAYVGATQETLERGLASLRRRYPELDIDGCNGFFDPNDDEPGSRAEEIVGWLRDRSHDVVIVGMGMPRQEEWIARVQHRVPTRVFLPTGGYLDYQVGRQKLPPRWMGQIGLEWVYRLIHSPRRLGYRYLVEPMLLAQRLLTRRHPQRAGKQGADS